jgi:hypothetical protein
MKDTGETVHLATAADVTNVSIVTDTLEHERGSQADVDATILSSKRTRSTLKQSMKDKLRRVFEIRQG